MTLSAIIFQKVTIAFVPSLFLRLPNKSYVSVVRVFGTNGSLN